MNARGQDNLFSALESKQVMSLVIYRSADTSRSIFDFEKDGIIAMTTNLVKLSTATYKELMGASAA